MYHKIYLQSRVGEQIFFILKGHWTGKAMKTLNSLEFESGGWKT